MHKGILAGTFVVIMLISVSIGVWSYQGTPTPQTQPQASTNSHISRSIHHEPYGDVLTTKETATKNGVHYQIINERVMPTQHTPRMSQPAPAKPRVLIQNTPHGKTMIIEEHGAQNGANYHVIEKTQYQRLTPEQAQQLQGPILKHQHAIEQEITRQMQQFQQVTPPIRFYQAPLSNRNH